LFREISFTVSEGDRIGIVGPNGSGKSTLLAMLDGRVLPDSGDVAVRKGMRVSGVQQISEYAAGDTVRSVIDAALDRAKVAEAERGGRKAEILGRAGFADVEARADSLSGGWRKRLGIVEALVQHPDVLLLDEPTNHLDLAGIEWLEGVLQNAAFACVVVSHDRYFLENVATAIVEINPVYENGTFRVEGNYSTFLEGKEAYLHAQRNRQEALENRVHTEIDWLRRGPKARTTKSKASGRIGDPRNRGPRRAFGRRPVLTIGQNRAQQLARRADNRSPRMRVAFAPALGELLRLIHGPVGRRRRLRIRFDFSTNGRFAGL